MLTCCAEISVAFSIALSVYGCMITAYSYGKSTTLAIWLGVLIPFGLLSVICGLVGVGQGFIFVGMLIFSCMMVSLKSTYLWLLPWWIMTQNGTLNSVDATAEQWIQNNSIPDFGSSLCELDVIIMCSCLLLAS
jgi:hypothetical protein